MDDDDDDDDDDDNDNSASYELWGEGGVWHEGLHTRLPLFIWIVNVILLKVKQAKWQNG